MTPLQIYPGATFKKKKVQNQKILGCAEFDMLKNHWCEDEMTQMN